MPALTDIFFDLDNTLWDFEKNARLTLEGLFVQFFPKPTFSFAQFHLAFKQVNAQLWDLNARKLITKEEIRKRRFVLIFDKLKVPKRYRPAPIGELFVQTCSSMPHLVEGAMDLLEYLAPKYNLHLITNGFEDVQSKKVESGQIKQFFKTTTTCDCSIFRKPDVEMYQIALQKARVLPQNACMIGDSLSADVIGAKNAGLSTIFFNPNDVKETPKEADYQVNHLSQISTIL